MEALITLFENNDEDWELALTRYSHAGELFDKFNIDVQASATKGRVKENIKKRLEGLLSSGDVLASDFAIVQTHVTLKHLLSNTHSHAYTFLQLVQYYIGCCPSYPSQNEAWFEVKALIEAMASLGNYETDKHQATNPKPEDIVVVNSAKALIAKQFSIKIVRGKVELDDSSEKRLLEALDYRFKKMGHFALQATLNCMSEHYDRASKRYYLRDISPPANKHHARVPWGYLFNLSLANIHEPATSKKLKKWFSECIELAQHYFCIQELQTFNIFKDMFHTHNTILPAIQKQILFDQHYALDQINAEHMIAMIEGQFTSTTVTAKGIDTTIYVDLLKWASKKATHNTVLLFTPEQLMHELGLKHTLSDIIVALAELTQDASSLNKGYLKPEDIAKRNYFMKPFVKTGENYCYVNPILCNFGFYYALEQKVNPSRRNGDIVGDIAEELVSSLLNKHGISFMAEKKYNVSEEIRKDLKVKSQERECDFIIETASTIIFLELKRKTLTSHSRAGNTLASIIDVSQSLFHALAQTGTHEYTLRKQGEITFVDGTELHLKDRKVERVALTLFGYFGLQDGPFVNTILKALINARIESSNVKEDKKANKYLEELKHQYETDIFYQQYYKDFQSAFLNCRFFSIAQLLTLLENAKDNETFLIEFNRTRNMTSGSKDWFREYECYRNRSTNIKS